MMKDPAGQNLPIRVGVFDSIGSAQRAVKGLLDAGFPKGKISVLCSDQLKERFFREFEHQDPAGTTTPKSAAIGGEIGAVLGGAAAVAAAAATGGVTLFLYGGIGVWSGAAVGAFIGAMMSRGVEKGLADYYDQSVVQGKLLVAAEDEGPDAAANLAAAERVLSEAGAIPVALSEG